MKITEEEVPLLNELLKEQVFYKEGMVAIGDIRGCNIYIDGKVANDMEARSVLSWATTEVIKRRG